MIQIVRVPILVITACMLGACAGQPVDRVPTYMPSASALPAARPGLDHYIAWIPLEQAQTATVAEAMTHISLSTAREQAGQDLCGGDRITAGSVTEKHGPVLVRMPASRGGRPAWYYRISQQPGLDGCQTARDGDLYRALQVRLPRWITVSPAGSAGRQLLGMSTKR